MKNTMRKLFSLALVVVMLACAIPFSAFALSELEVAREKQTEATAAYNNALAKYNEAKTNLDSVSADLKEAKETAATAKTEWNDAVLAQQVAATKKAETQRAWEKEQNDSTYAANHSAGLALEAANTTLAAKQAALNTAETEVETQQGRYDYYEGIFNTAKSNYNNAVIAKKAADEFLKVAEQNANVNINDNIIGGGSILGSLGSSNGSTTVIIGSGSTGTGTGSNIGNIVIGSGSTSGTTGGTIISGGTGTNTGSNNNTSGGIWLGNNNTVVNKDPYPVYLNIYLNGNVSTIAKKVDITKGIAADGYVDLADVSTVVKSYFNAKDSDGILYDGLYIFDGSFGGQYTTDVGRVDGYGNINEDRKLSTVNINVMIKNAVAKGSVAADTSNPKTGDMAFLTVTALVASAGALALVYANKKRFLVK